MEGLGAAPDGSFYQRVRLRAVPDKDKANEALLELNSSELGMRSREIALTASPTSSIKTMLIGDDRGTLAKRLERALTLPQ